MPEETTGQEPAGGEGQEPAPGTDDGTEQQPTGEATTPETPPEPDDTGDGGDDDTGESPQTFDADYVKKLRDEAAKWRREARDLETKNKEYERERMSEQERLKAEADEAKQSAEAAESRAKKALADAALAQEASKQGVDVTLLGRLVDVEFDDDGMPTGVSDAVSQVLKDYPQLKPQQPQQTPANPANPGRQRQKLTKDDVKRMSSDEINARWDEVQAVLSDN